MRLLIRVQACRLLVPWYDHERQDDHDDEEGDDDNDDGGGDDDDVGDNHLACPPLRLAV